jgi:hypothetical protein
MIHLIQIHMAHAAAACKGDAATAALASTAVVAGAPPPPAADRFRNSMQSSTASLRYESVYATEAAGLTRAAALDGVAVTDVAARRRVPGAPPHFVVVVAAVDVADSMASRSTTSRTRSSIDTCVAAAPRRDLRPPLPPRSLGMHVTVASFKCRGSA